MKSKKLYILALIILVTFNNLYSQAIGTERGIPSVTFLPPKEFKSHPQNWSIVQDSKGIIYVGNNLSGVLQYDGVSWRKIYVPNGIVESIAIDFNDRVYVGGYNTFGYLEPDSVGSYQFVSLYNKSYGNLQIITGTHTSKNGVYFQASSKVIFLENDNIKSWNPKTSFGNSFLIRDKFFVSQKGEGIMSIYNDELKLIPGGAKFANENITSILPYDNDRLIFAASKNLFLYDGKKFYPFNTDADELLNTITHAVMLPDSTYAISTINSGIIVISKEGKTTRILDRTSGLNSNKVIRLFVDNQKALWAILTSGLARINYPSPITFFENEIDSYSIADAIDAERHNGELYVVNSSGLFRLKTQSLIKNEKSTKLNFSRFENILPESINSRELLSIGEHLLVSSSKGIFSINQNKSKLIKKYEQTIYKMYRSRKDSMRVFVGTEEGLFSLRLAKTGSDTKWIDEGLIEGLKGQVRTMYEDKNWKLWVGGDFEGVRRLDFSNGFASPEIEYFNESHGLIPGKERNDVQIFTIDGSPLFVDENGIFRFNELKKSFVPERLFGTELFNGTYRVWTCAEDKNGNIYFNVENENGDFYAMSKKISDGKYNFTEIPFRAITQTPSDLIYTDFDSSVWFGTDGFLINYDPTVTEKIKTDSISNFTTLIRKVLIRKDSLVLGGDVLINSDEIIDKTYPLEFEYSGNSIRFEFAATSFDNASSNLYKYYLEGLEDDWGLWQYDTYHEYTLLPPGNYVFRVKGKNIYDQISSEAYYAFSIVPPWYITLPAFVLYVAIFIIFLSLIIKYREKRTIKIEREKSKQRAQIRKEMAADFHDGAGDKLAQISLFSKFVLSKTPKSFKEIHNALQWTVEAAEALKLETRDFIWTFDTEHNSLWDAVDRIVNHGKNLFSRNQNKIDFNIHGFDIKLKSIILPLIWKRNLIFIFKESLTNAFKYSKASEINIYFSVEHGNLNIRLEDNGIGINAKEEYGSKGLNNMYMRAKKINAELVMDSELNQGTVINFKCKLPTDEFPN